MRKAILSVALLSFAASAAAHVTPNVSLVRRGDFIRQAFPAAGKFFEKTLDGKTLDAVARSIGWRPSEEEARVYVARTSEGKLVGTAVFLWIPSQHGPVGVGTAFDPEGALLQAAVTDVGTEPLAWVRPLLAQNRLEPFAGLKLDGAPDPDRIAPAEAGAMTRYYARVISDGIRRAQALEKAAREEIH
jgi:hypothetical protein